MTGKEIREWRERRQISREDLARLCSVSYAAVANWELDRNSPHGAALERLKVLMDGQVAIVPLTQLEEKILDEAVERGRFESREAYLAAGLTEVIRGNLSGRPLYSLLPIPDLKVAEEPTEDCFSLPNSARSAITNP